MKNILTYKLFENSSEFQEVFQNIKDILIEIEDMGIPVSSKIYGKETLMFSIPDIQNKESIILTNEILDIIERIKEYCLYTNYSIIYLRLKYMSQISPSHLPPGYKTDKYNNTYLTNTDKLIEFIGIKCLIEIFVERIDKKPGLS